MQLYVTCFFSHFIISDWGLEFRSPKSHKSSEGMVATYHPSSLEAETEIPRASWLAGLVDAWVLSSTEKHRLSKQETCPGRHFMSSHAQRQVPMYQHTHARMQGCTHMHVHIHTQRSLHKSMINMMTQNSCFLLQWSWGFQGTLHMLIQTALSW